MKTEFLNKRLERLEQLNLLRDLDFEEGRELAEIKRIKQLIIGSVSNRIMALPLEKKHKLLALFFSNTKVVRKGSNEAIDFLKNQRRIVMNDELEKHGYLGSEMLAIKKILSLVYGC